MDQVPISPPNSIFSSSGVQIPPTTVPQPFSQPSSAFAPTFPISNPASFPQVFPAAAPNATASITQVFPPFPAGVQEAQNHVAHGDQPGANVSPSLNHPPYAEMIYAAISSLKGKNGSTRSAIAKYIEQTYSDLPSSHSALLAHHLKHLKNSGLLVLEKKSYMLPRSDSSAPPAPPTPAAAAGSGPGTARRGRPPKPKPAAEPVTVPVGLSVEPELVKRGPGRPPKSEAVGLTVAVAQSGPTPSPKKRGRGRPPGSKSGHLGPRVPKPKSVLGPNGIKRGRGRPRKAQAVFLMDSSSVAPAVMATSVPRPRGRPRKYPAVPAAVGVADGGQAAIPVRRPGRPPKDGVRRSVGRPRKYPLNGTSEAANLENAAYENLKRKLEYVQSKVKDAIGVIKPHLANVIDISVLSAIQDLEMLSTTDFVGPPNDGAQQQQPQQQILG